MGVSVRGVGVYVILRKNAENARSDTYPAVSGPAARSSRPTSSRKWQNTCVSILTSETAARRDV